MLTRRKVLWGVPLVTAAALAGGSGVAWAEALPVLTDTEIEGIVFMREEEKLARDVYAMLYERWQTPVFRTIGSSEVSHMAAMKTLLDRYGVEDPAATRPAGVFQNRTLQRLYDDLVVAGQESRVAALKAGTAVEEIDILDLEERLGQTDESPIQRVYGNLLNGSHNHLRAFARQLSQISGEPFVPQYMDQATVDEILAQRSGRSRRRGGR
ncbi:MAG: DUF2202 domain-containing protein [Anaerolineae bacterium]|nr:DUF2202 domain-containing protein [Anaerolineae bacterium]